MTIVLTIIHVLVCFFLVVVVLLQSGKAADLAGAFGGAGSQTAFGPRGAANILSKATTWCAIMFMLCAMALVLRTDKALVQGGGSVLQNVSKPAPKKAPATTPATPAAPQPNTQAPSQQPATQQAPPPQPGTQQPVQQAPAASPPASAPPKKP